MSKDGKEVLDDRFYTETHDWVKKTGKNRYQIGITDYAQHNLKDIYAVELPKVGTVLKQFQKYGTLEAEKNSFELAIPASGKVIATNEANLGDVYDTEEPNPTTIGYGGDLVNINKKPYETWLIEIETDDESQLEKLITAEEYKKKIGA